MKTLDASAIAANPELLQVAMRGGEVIFKENCAACHGVGGVGAKGYPALVDDEWLWGGTIPEIVQTIVITSYSIHYTKLYEALTVFHRPR